MFFTEGRFLVNAQMLCGTGASFIFFPPLRQIGQEVTQHLLLEGKPETLEKTLPGKQLKPATSHTVVVECLHTGPPDASWIQLPLDLFSLLLFDPLQPLESSIDISLHSRLLCLLLCPQLLCSHVFFHALSTLQLLVEASLVSCPLLYGLLASPACGLEKKSTCREIER